MVGMSDDHDPPDDQDVRDNARRAALATLLNIDDFRPVSASVRVECAAHSRPGCGSAANDDHYLVVKLTRSQETVATSLSALDLPPRFEESGYAMLVADGLGEGGAGSTASRVALSTIAHLALHHGKWNVRIEPDTAVEILDRAQWFYARADAAVAARSRFQPVTKGISTALTAAYSAGDQLFVAHVGHSRAYLFRDGALMLLTRDQTLGDHMTSVLRPESAERRAQDLRHILTDAVGATGGPPQVDVDQLALKHGDLVLLCTNGLTDALDDNQIADVLAGRRRPAELCERLTALAIERGGQDDVTAIVAQYQIPT
jgi:serine/threonine protein phosphatase PrpC